MGHILVEESQRVGQVALLQGMILEHNGLVLGDLLGLGPEKLEDLERQGVIGATPVGAA